MTEQTALALTASVVGFVSAIFFCIGNAFNSVEKITLQSTMFWDFSEPVARALASQRAQYVTGGLLLLISFALQLLATVASSTHAAAFPQWLHIWPYFVLAVLIPTAFASRFFCQWLDHATISRVLQKHKADLATQEK